MKQLGICGHFGSNENINGQMVKTRILTSELTDYFGKDEVVLVDSFGWKNRSFRLFFECVGLSIKCRNVLILPAAGGIKVFAPLFALLCGLFRRKLHYSVIGGWLPLLLSENRGLIKYIKSMTAVYVETESMRKSLSELGIANAVFMPNFKSISVLKKKDLPGSYKEPYSLCTFSRVKKAKGILDAIDVIKKFNGKTGKKVFALDIYGSIDEDFEQEFKAAVSDNNSFVNYKGVAEFSKSTEILKNYFALLFPTYYDGEGFPGTVIDAFSSGLPVIATDWLYNSEIVTDGVTGYIYNITENDRTSGLFEVLTAVYNSPDSLIRMKKNCLLEAKKYDSSAVMRTMIKRME